MKLVGSPSRREILQVGCSGMLGLSLPALAEARASATTRARAKSVVLIFLTGGPSQLDTFDLKPDAPDNIRSPFRPIATNAPGVQISECLPRLAAHGDKLAIVRSMTHGIAIHEIGTHLVLTGIDKLPPGSTHMASRHDWPHYSGGLNYLRPRQDGLPNAVSLPTYLQNGYGFSGQDGGILGARFDPWQIRQNPGDPAFRVENLNFAVDLTGRRIEDRRSLLAEIDRQRTGLMSLEGPRQLGRQQQQAVDILTSGQLTRAFDLNQEAATVRDRYGRHLFGQSLLLTRRLIEAGVSLVQANMGVMNTWDTHYNNCKQLRESLLPPLDQGVAALLDDLSTRGLLDETLVVIVGEFGRTPRMGLETGGTNETPGDGRDHWAGVFSAAFAGGGVRGGQIVGRSDRIAAFPMTNPYRPSDIGATIYSALGIDPDSEVHDRLGRPLRLNGGQVITPLFSGASV